MFGARAIQFHRMLAPKAASLPVSLGVLVLLVIGLLAMRAAFSNTGTEPGNLDRASILIARAITGLGDPTAAPPLRPPGYPLVLSTLAYLDADVATALTCASEPPSGCGADVPFHLLVWVQFVVAIMTLAVICLLAVELSGSTQVALITVVLAYLYGGYATAAGRFFAATWYQASALITLYLMATAVTRSSSARFLAAGIGTGFTALFEPTFAVAIIAAALSVRYWAKSATAHLLPFTFMVTGLALSLVPALIFAQSMQYDLDGFARHMAWHLSERMAFNRLDAVSWLAGLLLPVPFVTSVAGVAFPEAVVASFGYYTPGTYVYEGANRIFPLVIAHPGGPTAGIVWLAQTRLLPEISGYVAALLPLFMRGLLGATGVFGLIGLLHVPRMFTWAHVERSRQASAAMVTFHTTGAVLLVNTLLTANPAGLNATIPFVFAYAIAYVAAGL